MKKVAAFALFFVCTSFCLVFAEELIRGPLPEKFPPPEKCSACHNVSQIYQELRQSAHRGLKCLDCHLPGAIQRIRYESRDCSFSRLGYHLKEGKWVEVRGNQVCLRCHAARKTPDTGQKCWSCHMPPSGTDQVVILKDKKAPVTPDNIRETKELPHRLHSFKYHSGIR